MKFNIFKTLYNRLRDWLIFEPPVSTVPLCDFEKIQYEVRPCDVILIEGRSRISTIIRSVTNSPWTHAALYIGRLHDIEDPAMRAKVAQHYPEIANQQLIIESMLGQGTIIQPLTHYEGEHIRICRPKGIQPKDSQSVLNHAISRLGTDYDVRHILDLFRFLMPWTLMPRRWRSSIFKRKSSHETKEICSSMIAEAFTRVQFPVLPFVTEHEEKGIELIPRNPRLFTPSDFDYSPYFEIIKYPIFEVGAGPLYRSLPWSQSGVVSHDHGHFSEAQAKSEADKPEETQSVADKASQPESSSDGASQLNDASHGADQGETSDNESTLPDEDKKS